MIKHTFFAATVSLAMVAAAPLGAQDDGTPQDAEADAMSEMFSNMFGEAEPLTAEQEARMPAAEMVVERIFPEGTYAKMMNDTMKPMMDGMMGSFMDVPVNEIAKLTGLYSGDVQELGEGSINEIMAILDPVFQDRTKMMTDITLQLVTETMTQIEPGYRAGLARAYAVRFTEAELADMNAYFSTPTGTKYAAESMLIYTDPQVMSAMNEMMPAMMNMMPDMMSQIAEASEQLPPARTFSDLNDAEKAKLSDLLGMSPEDLADIEPSGEDEEWGDDADSLDDNAI